MPTIVKMKYVRELQQQIAAHPDLSDVELAALLTAPTKAGERLDRISADAAKGQTPWQEAAQVEAQAVADAPKSAAAQLAAQAWVGRLDQFDFAGNDASLLAALVAEGLLSTATRDAILAAATVDVPGPSAAQTLGLGECLPEFIAQVREYEGLSEQEIKEQLAALLLVSWLRPWLPKVATAENVLALPDYAKFRAEVILPYTEMADAKAADMVMGEVLTMLKEREV